MARLAMTCQQGVRSRRGSPKIVVTPVAVISAQSEARLCLFSGTESTLWQGAAPASAARLRVARTLCRTSFAFMFDCVPLPVCQITSGK
jgi:hypothetical protein